jgi:hypothetical protein
MLLRAVADKQDTLWVYLPGEEAYRQIAGYTTPGMNQSTAISTRIGGRPQPLGHEGLSAISGSISAEKKSRR